MPYLLFILILTVSANPLVNTTCGPVEGVWDIVPGLAKFLGIPFAQAPVGRLRWMPPEDPTCWGSNVTFQAKTEPFACPQLSLGSTVEQSEDCLYLNVYTTLPQTPVPVLVWVYGGSSVDGFTDSYGRIQNIVTLLQGQVVLVAFNYRLNSFGYLALKELSAIDPRGVSGNYGILDCQHALLWVQRYISSFGGDPNRVTVFGQSSGGTQILGLLASPGTKGLIHGAISLSGSPNISMPLSVMEEQGLQLVNQTNCSGVADVLQCLYSLDTDTLRKATPQHWSYEGDFLADTVTPNPAPYPGLVIADGVTVRPLMDALFEGLIDVPTIIASVQCEDGAPDFVIPWNLSDFNSFCVKQFSGWPSEVAPTLETLYQDLATSNAGFAYASMESDVNMACGNAIAAVAAGQGFASPVYLALNAHWPSHPIYHSADASGVPKMFPYHTWDTTCAFETWGGWEAKDVPWIPQHSDLAYGEVLRQMWFSIAAHAPAFLAVNNNTNFPTSYNTLVLSDKPSSVNNYKTALCNKLMGLGLDEKFWWVN